MARRHQLGKLSQADAAEIMKVDQSTVSRWELDKSIPEEDAFPALSEFLQLSIEEVRELVFLQRPILTRYYPDPQSMGRAMRGTADDWSEDEWAAADAVVQALRSRRPVTDDE